MAANEDINHKLDQLTQSGILVLNDVKLNDIVTDREKQPVRVAANFFGGDEINTIWAEKTDYIATPNLGESFINTPILAVDAHGNTDFNIDADLNMTGDLSYRLDLRPADKKTLGGVKLPNDESIYYDKDSDEMRVDFDAIKETAKIRSKTSAGVVLPGSGFLYNEETGLLTFDEINYGIKIPSVINPNNQLMGAGKRGGIRIGNGLTVTTANKLEHQSTVQQGDDEATEQSNASNTAKYLDVIRVQTNAFNDRDVVDSTSNKFFKNIFQYTQSELVSTKQNEVSLVSTNGKSAETSTTLDYFTNLSVEAFVKLEAQLNSLKSQVDQFMTSSSVNGKLISGSARFNGRYMGVTGVRTGRQITFDEALPSVDYHVMVCQTSVSMGDVGVVSIANKTETGFIVSSSGNNIDDTFSYLVVPNDVIYTLDYIRDDSLEGFGLHKLPIKRGSGIFTNNDIGAIVSLNNKPKVVKNGELVDSTGGGNGSAFANTNYAVFITIQDHEKATDVGEVSVISKATNQFAVKITGDVLLSDKVYFDWIAVPFGDGSALDSTNEYYDMAMFPIRCGSKASTDGTCGVQMGSYAFTNVTYIVCAQLASDVEGAMGEYSVDIASKTRSSFDFTKSGAAQEFTLDWITIG